MLMDEKCSASQAQMIWHCTHFARSHHTSLNFDHEHGFLLKVVHLYVLFILQCPFWVCRLPMRGRCAWACHFTAVTFDLGAMTLNLGILWTSHVQGIAAVMTNLLLWTTHEGEMCMGLEFLSCDCWLYDLDLGNLVNLGNVVDALVSKVLMST